VWGPLRESQKVRLHYGVGAREIREELDEARRRPGSVSHTLLSRLELRLCNVVFRLGFAPHGPPSRHLVTVGHVRVNGVRMDCPDHRLQVGDVVRLSERAYRIPRIAQAMSEGPELPLPTYLGRWAGGRAGRVVHLPRPADVPFSVDDAALLDAGAR
jgi:small subunit ribosomal protein S4